MSLPQLLGVLTLAPALCALLIAVLGVARFAQKGLALALALVGLLLPIAMLLTLTSEFSSSNPVFIGLFGGTTGLNDWFSAVYRVDGLALYAGFGITIIVAPLLVWIAWKGPAAPADAGVLEDGTSVTSANTESEETASRQVAWPLAHLSRAQWGGVALALAIESSVLTMVFADNVIWLALAWVVLVVLVWGIGELGSDLDTIDRIGLALMVIGPLCWAGAMLVPAIGHHGTRTIYPRLTDMMGRGGFTPLHVLILAVALTLAGAGFPFIVWMRRRALLVTPAGLVALVSVLLPAAIIVGARTYSAAQDANSSWQEIGQTAPPINAGIWFCVLGMLTVCVSGLLALGRRDSRTLLAFLAVSQVGWGLLALGAGDPTSMLGLVTLLATSLLGLGAMAAALFAGGTLTSDIEPDGAGPRPFGVPLQPIALGAWIVGALTLVGAPLFGGFVARQMISASIIHSRGLAVPLVGTAWAGDALLGLALLRATAPAFTTLLGSGRLVTASSNEDERPVQPRFQNLTVVLPLVPAAILGLLAILAGAVPQVLLQLGGLPAASALVQAGAANQALTISTIGYQLEAGQWLPSLAWLAIIVLALVVLFALPASLRETKPVYLAGMAATPERVEAGENTANDEQQPEEMSAELAYLPEPVDTWSELDAAFTSPLLLPLGELLLRGIDEDYPREDEPSEEDEDEDEPEVPASQPTSAVTPSESPESKTTESARKPDRSAKAGPPATSQSNQRNSSGTTISSGGSGRNSKTGGLKKGGKGSGR